MGALPGTSTLGLGRLVLGLSLGLIFGAGLWLRVTSLEVCPQVMGDEAWYGIQASRLIAGESIAAKTPTGNPLNPFYVGLLVPLLLVFDPEIWVLRVPAVASGISAVVLAYVLGARIFDRVTALIAAGLLSALPALIVFARVGWDAAQVPLINVLAISCAFRGRWAALAIVFAISYIIHPTNLFLTPMLLAVAVVASIVRDPEPWLRRRRAILATAGALGALLIPVGLALLKNPTVRGVRRGFDGGSADELGFLVRFERLLLGFGEGIRFAPTPWIDGLFWGVVGALAILGTAGLIRQRHWDRLAMVGGLLVSAGGFYLVAGAGAIRPETGRYGLFLVTPTALAMAFLVRATLVEPIGPWRAIVRQGQHAALIALAGALLFLIKVNWFDWQVQVIFRDESLWTLRTETEDPYRRALDLIRQEIDDSDGEGPGLLIAQDWWTHRPLQYLAGPKGPIRVVDYQRMGRSPEQHRDLLCKWMAEGAFAICYVGEEIEATLFESFPSDRLVRRVVPIQEIPYLSILSLRPLQKVAAEGASEEALRR